jgi:hypothetical protein
LSKEGGGRRKEEGVTAFLVTIVPEVWEGEKMFKLC